MAGPWIVDGNRIASKIRSVSATTGREIVRWKSNPTKACPNCHHLIDNSDVAQEWPGLPRGVKFDPTDQEIICHLLAKVVGDGLKPHPFIDEFIPTVDKDDGICYTHPQNLPGMKKDGTVSHFFHRAIKAYNTGTRKRRKIHGDDLGDVRWHKTGRTKAVVLDGVQRGCKKIMVLYMSSARGGKAEKTNWVMHQYHLGTEEEERDGEYIISKIFYDQQKTNKEDKSEEDLSALGDPLIAKVDPNTPKSATPEPPCAERRYPDFDMGLDPTTAFEDPSPMNSKVSDAEDEVQPHWEGLCGDAVSEVKQGDHMADGNEKLNEEMQADDMADGDEKLIEEIRANDTADGNDHNAEEYPKWWDSESQNLLDSQQLVEALTLCDEFLLSQSPKRDAHGHQTANNKKPSFSDYTQLGPENLKKDLEECQNLAVDPANIELDTPPEFRLSQLEFGSQDSFIAWGGGGKIVD